MNMLNILNIINNRPKGQAAITDALFFLTIIVTLSILLFKFSSTYGDRIDLATSNHYFKEYSNSAMKTIFYSEVPLDYSLDLETAKEVDYLMTSIKADYFKDGVIGKKPTGVSGDDHQHINKISAQDGDDIAKYNLYHTIKAVMYPLPTYDYVFYLYNLNKERFEFVLIKITDFGEAEQSTNYQVTYEEEPIPKYYLCNPTSYSKIRALVERVNRVYASSIPLQFVVNNADKQINNTFATWAATTSIQPTDLISDDMGCIEIDDEEIKNEASLYPLMD